MSQLRKQFKSIYTDSLSIKKNTVQQTSSITSGVTINSPAGTIVTNTTGNVATSGTATINVNNNTIYTNSIIIGRLNNYSGSGYPNVYINNVTTGSFQVHIKNTNATNPVSGGFNIDFFSL